MPIRRPISFLLSASTIGTWNVVRIPPVVLDTLNAVDSVCLNSVLGTDEKFVYAVEASLDMAGLPAVAAAAALSCS